MSLLTWQLIEAAASVACGVFLVRVACVLVGRTERKWAD